jgi:hypothetical protein
MMSDICRLAAGISAHLAMEEACIEYCSDRRKHKKSGGNHPASNVTLDCFIKGA